MKTEISRRTFRPERRYSGVFQQQGRMALDADWNELVEIVRAHLVDVLLDVVGGGAPGDGGLGIEDGPMIRPGRIYADGLDGLFPGGAPVAYPDQPDFPDPPPLPDDPCVLYADVWDRTVTALEDPELMDPGLHGADTTTRTRRMVQVKWAPDDWHPETLPRRGDARLTVRFREDPGPEVEDPCAPVLTGEGIQIANDLLRVEIHQSTPPEDATRLVVKWSRANGAHARRRADGLEDSFTSAARAFEFFSPDTESWRGIHPPAASVARGRLEPAWPDAPPEETDLPLVRQWDGYAVLVDDGGSWAVAGGGESPDETARAVDVRVEAGALVVELEELVLELDLDGRILLEGDHWLVPVRRELYEPGLLLADGAEPDGIVHRYLTLASLDADGDVVPPSTEERRRMAFPRLTELGAGDVGYAPDCPSGLFTPDHDTVKKALDRVCGIEAGHVAFQKTCDTSVFRGTDPETVAEALELLCDVRAGQVGYEGPDDVTTVDEALDDLFARPVGGGGCAVTVGEGGQFDTIIEALRAAVEREERNPCICLLPGEHEAGELEELEPDQEGWSLSLHGCGSRTRLVTDHELEFSRLDRLEMTGLDVVWKAPGFFMVQRMGEVLFRDCSFTGLTTEGAFLGFERVGRLGIEGCRVEPTRRERPILEVLEPVPDLRELLKERPPLWEARTELRDLADALEAMGRGERRRIADQLEEGARQARRRDRIGDLAAGLATSLGQVIARGATGRLTGLLGSIFRVAPDLELLPAVALVEAVDDVTIRDTRIDGILTLHGEVPSAPPGLDRGDDEVVLGWSQLVQLGNVMREMGRGEIRGRGRLELEASRVGRVTVGRAMAKRILRMVRSQEEILEGPYAVTHLTDNELTGAFSLFMAQGTTLQGNHLTGRLVQGMDELGAVLAERALYTGNHHVDGHDEDTFLVNVSLRPSRGTAARDELNEIFIRDR